MLPTADAHLDMAELAGDRWVLVGATGVGERDREIPLSGRRIVIGRRPERDLVISHPTVSSLHAEIVRRDDSLFITDLNSTNGTRVNERRIDQQTPLKSGDQIRFGSLEMMIELRSMEPQDGGRLMVNSFEMTSRFLGFERLLNELAIVPHYQPIVSLRDRGLVAYEVLARSAASGFETPARMIKTAEQMQLEHDFSDVCRVVGVQHSSCLAENRRLYLNTHREEIGTPELLASLKRLREAAPHQEITLEIHEALVTNLWAMTELRGHLNELNIQLAYDDFGAGPARLLALSEVPPDVLKFDISLIRGLAAVGWKRQQMVATLVLMALDFGIAPLAKGVESEKDMEICRKIGFELAQGYFFGRPRPADRFDTSTSETAIQPGC